MRSRLSPPISFSKPMDAFKPAFSVNNEATWAVRWVLLSFIRSSSTSDLWTYCLTPSRVSFLSTTFNPMKMKVMTRQTGSKEIKKVRVASERLRTTGCAPRRGSEYVGVRRWRPQLPGPFFEKSRRSCARPPACRRRGEHRGKKTFHLRRGARTSGSEPRQWPRTCLDGGDNRLARLRGCQISGFESDPPDSSPDRTALC